MSSFGKNIAETITEASHLGDFECFLEFNQSRIGTSQTVITLMDSKIELFDCLLSVWWCIEEDLQLEPSWASEKLEQDFRE